MTVDLLRVVYCKASSFFSIPFSFVFENETQITCSNLNGGRMDEISSLDDGRWTMNDDGGNRKQMQYAIHNP